MPYLTPRRGYSEWRRRRPRFTGETILVGVRMSGVSGMSTRPEVWREVSSGASLEERVAAIEVNLDRVREWHNEIRVETGNGLTRLSASDHCPKAHPSPSGWSQERATLLEFPRRLRARTR